MDLDVEDLATVVTTVFVNAVRNRVLDLTVDDALVDLRQLRLPVSPTATGVAARRLALGDSHDGLLSCQPAQVPD